MTFCRTNSLSRATVIATAFSAVSITQLIYMSEIGRIIMDSKLPVSLKNLFIIFLECTIVTLPVIVLAAHILF